MGIIDKFKGLFYEDVPEEEKQEETEEIELPVQEERQEENDLEDVISERDLFKSDTTFKFPIKFDDEEVKDMNPLNLMEKVKEEKKEEPIEKKLFRPSPVISPVYGILDKHYEKDDMPEKAKGKLITIEKKEHKPNIDEIRKKAYGTLEDDLEKTMSDEVDLFDLEMANTEEMPELMNDLKEEISIEASKVTFGDAEENFDDFGIEYDSNKLADELMTVPEAEEEEPIELTEESDEEKDDLFDMIDSMYEEESEEE